MYTFWLLIFTILVCSSSVESQDHNRRKREILKEDDALLDAGLFEGDIAGVDSQTLNSVLNGTEYWSERIIPYIIDDAVGYVGRRAIRKAISSVETKTCIRFRNASETDQDFVQFIYGKGCSSYVGKQGGKQDVSIGDGCEQVGIILHLLMHVLGFWHEESRLDRDLYILINWDNIDTENAKYFEKYTIPIINVKSAVDPRASPYDYESITHISPYAYAKNKDIPTILAKDERFKIGQRLGLSQNDVNAIVRTYCGRRQATPSAHTMTQEEKVIYDKTVQTQTSGAGVEQSSVDEENEEELINPEQPEGCRDTSRKCPLWATQGLCYKNPSVMAVKCAGSCQACQMLRTCDNTNSLCGIWAWLGNCVGKSAQKYLATCPLACGVCVPEDTEITNATGSIPPEWSIEPSTVPPRRPAGPSKIRPRPTTPKTPVRLTTSKPISTCGNKNKNCANWASKGRCFYKHVQRLCAESCNITCDIPLPGGGSKKPASSSSTGSKSHHRTPAPQFCKDKRKNCARFVPRGFCEKPIFQKQCQLSCNICSNVEPRAHDFPELDTIEENGYCRDYSYSVCNAMKNEEIAERCLLFDHVRRLCPLKCRACQGDNIEFGGKGGEVEMEMAAEKFHTEMLRMEREDVG